MKKVIFILILINIIMLHSYQFRILEEPKEVTNHVGFVNLPDEDRYDINGELCGMLIVRTGIEEMNIDSPLRHRLIPKEGEYWVILQPGAWYVDLKKQDYVTEMVNLRESIGKIESGKVYEMAVDGDGEVTEIPVVITCNQSGADVYIDDERVGTTQNKMLTVTMNQGQRVIKVTKDGFAAQAITEEVSVTKNSFHFDLVPAMPAAVTITSDPEGATVTIDNNMKLGVTPLDNFYDAGTYPIRIEKENYETINEQITIIEPATEKHYTLIDIRASLTVKTDKNATVIFNGKEYNGGIEKLVILPQTISFKIEQEFCETIEKTYTLKKSENKVFEFYPEDIGAILTVKTYDNATVKFNGESYKGGFANKKIAPQVLTITVEMLKAEPLEQIISLKPKAEETREMYPEVQTGVIQVMCIPVEAGFELKGDAGEYYQGTGRQTFMDVPVGEYELSVKADGYKSYKEKFLLKVDETVQKPVKLEEGSDAPEGMVFVEGGTFQMGSNDGDDDEKTVHSVTVSDFHIGKYEVTQQQYEEVMGKNPSSFKSSGKNAPVESVSWYDAVEFCNRLSEMEGLKKCYSGSGKSIRCDLSANGYRLPTEAEWEYAAKGGNKSRGYKYSGSNNLEDVGWYWDNAGKKTHPAGVKNSNELGIYDMSGNVWEWCWDWKGDYNGSAQTDPRGPSSGVSRVLRGGGWGNDASGCWSASRCDYTPGSSNCGIGFRLVLSSH